MTSRGATVRTVDRMNLRLVTTTAVSVAFLAGLAWLGYLLWSWDVTQAVPGLTGWLAKLVITGKVVKGAVIAAIAVVAGVAAVARRVGRRRPDATEPPAPPAPPAIPAPQADHAER